MSTLIGFDEISLPPIDVVYQAVLSVYFLGQSVNGGTTKVHIAGLLPDWDASTATWLRPKTGVAWQSAGAKGANDRTAPVDSLLVSNTEVGTWLEFDVTELVQAGTTSFILYGEHQGVNKAVYFPRMTTGMRASIRS